MAVEATSAGAILFRDTRGRREYLLLKSRPGDWEFPKGGVEGDEELQQTAIREVTEEAGIEQFRLLDGFRKDYDYVFEANGKTIHKTVHLFIAKSFEASAELSNEHRDLQWRDYEQAVNTVTQDGPREILEDAHDFLDEREEEDDDEA
ncbi:bis(5'-nucleosyl)-tetraphosphatase [Natrinema pallidum]|uniref:Bis(5'-nucleosyl)-tetraphosphatase [asymmetrical] n=1 Tax=Natrinema pallidum DSM 3751 TaxID=1227495 RepID=L9YM77_9EURY|nr:bis(5'-nucleosyl)-tetraphosphatase [Natrinema pallidum]ELY74781.1 NUDIX hydrolase [Natrinema pallidum DSM 3751]